MKIYNNFGGFREIGELGEWEEMSKAKKLFRRVFGGAGILIMLLLVATSFWTDRNVDFWASFVKHEPVNVPFWLSLLLTIIGNVFVLLANIGSEIFRLVQG